MININYSCLRDEMVASQIKNRGINDENVLSAFRSVCRELFVPDDQRQYAYSDSPLPIGYEQTISQPYMVALMTQALCVGEGAKVLEIGTGSGYQSAILSELGVRVYSIERVRELGDRAKVLFMHYGYDVKTKIGDGVLGWAEYAPYDRIIVTAAANYTPSLLLDQLEIGGKLIMPLGERAQQDLTVFKKISDKEAKKEKICACTFVPLVSDYGH